MFAGCADKTLPGRDFETSLAVCSGHDASKQQTELNWQRDKKLHTGCLSGTFLALLTALRQTSFLFLCMMKKKSERVFGETSNSVSLLGILLFIYTVIFSIRC